MQQLITYNFKIVPEKNEPAERLNKVLETSRAVSAIPQDQATDNSIGMRSGDEFIRFNEEPIEDMQF
jgi:hypothetical protein